MEVTRFVISLKNGNFMKQDFDESLERIKINTTDLSIDADLFNNKQTADRVLNEIISGNTNLLVIYDEDNPPIEVKDIRINFEEV
ncbi:hypothetical protein [Bacillus sp. AG4(2022)]|uniref:hypothetical protein n=1 Tax=Bacillus sp. AG4(2022) TaxID=2962594 RepID=UPI002882858D|nr:hypothetical protein [Bacillus sp. AG4(2022)]MDT0160404.1 hypothetical protein [Bacillus sp. AG4(2022)]